MFGSEQVAKFINVVMRGGKKSIAETIVYSALTMLTERLKKEDKSDDGDKGKKGGSTGSSVKAKGQYTQDEMLNACIVH